MNLNSVPKYDKFIVQSSICINLLHYISFCYELCCLQFLFRQLATVHSLTMPNKIMNFLQSQKLMSHRITVLSCPPKSKYARTQLQALVLSFFSGVIPPDPDGEGSEEEGEVGRDIGVMEGGNEGGRH